MEKLVRKAINSAELFTEKVRLRHTQNVLHNDDGSVILYIIPIHHMQQWCMD